MHTQSVIQLQYRPCKIYKDIQQAAILLAYGSICYMVGSDCSSMLTSLGMKYGLSVSSRSLSIGMFFTKSQNVCIGNPVTELTAITALISHC